MESKTAKLTIRLPRRDVESRQGVRQSPRHDGHGVHRPLPSSYARAGAAGTGAGGGGHHRPCAGRCRKRAGWARLIMSLSQPDRESRRGRRCHRSRSPGRARSPCGRPALGAMGRWGDGAMGRRGDGAPGSRRSPTLRRNVGVGVASAPAGRVISAPGPRQALHATARWQVSSPPTRWPVSGGPGRFPTPCASGP